MPYNMPNPSIEVPTKYGTFTLTFIDPDAERFDSRNQEQREDQRTVARVDGTGVINRIPVELSTRVVYATAYCRKGKELETPERYMRRDYNGVRGVRRMDVHSPFGSTEVTPGISKAVDTLIATDIRAAYEAHPELQLEAKRARLAYVIDRAERERDDKHKEYDSAEKALLSARRAFAEFNDVNPL